MEVIAHQAVSGDSYPEERLQPPQNLASDLLRFVVDDEPSVYDAADDMVKRFSFTEQPIGVHACSVRDCRG